MAKHLLLAGEPMGLLIAKQEGALDTVKDYSMAVAGAEFNVATGISRLGLKASYLTKLGDDPFGRLIERLIRRYTVTTKAIIGKFNEDPEFKRWIMVKAECSAKGAKHPVHYVMIER